MKKKIFFLVAVMIFVSLTTEARTSSRQTWAGKFFNVFSASHGYKIHGRKYVKKMKKLKNNTWIHGCRS